MSSTVKIKGLEKTQANAIAILFEGGELISFINEKITEKYEGLVKPLGSAWPDFDDSEYSVDHIIEIEN